MKKRVKSKIATWGIILIIIVGALVYINSKKNPETSDEIAKCIGKKAELYIQLGCNACETQKEMFGENSEYLTIIDCWYEREKCSEIQYTPTWIIKGKKYTGVQSIEKLQELTGC